MKLLTLTIGIFFTSLSNAKTTECFFDQIYFQIDQSSGYAQIQDDLVLKNNVKFTVMDFLSHGLMFDEVIPETQETFTRVNIQINQRSTDGSHPATMQILRKTTEFVPSCWDGCDNTIQYPSVEVSSETIGLCKIN